MEFKREERKRDGGRRSRKLGFARAIWRKGRIRERIVASSTYGRSSDLFYLSHLSLRYNLFRVLSILPTIDSIPLRFPLTIGDFMEKKEMEDRRCKKEMQLNRDNELEKRREKWDRKDRIPDRK